MVLFFALFGFLFLSTQYLQFVLGYSPSAAGVRVLPYAGAMIVFAPLSAKLVGALGTKRVVTTGMLLFSAGLAVAATVTTDSGYGRLAVAFLLMGAGMGLAGARRPSRSSARSRPSGPTSGPRSTTRRASSAARWASPSWAASCPRSTRAGCPRDAPAVARESLGAAVQVGGLAEAAREAFVHAMSRASIVVAVVAALGAVIAWRFLPASELRHVDAVALPDLAQDARG